MQLHPGVDFSAELNSDGNTNTLWRVEPAVAEGADAPWSRPSPASTSVTAFPLSPIPPFSTDTPPQDLDAESSDEELPKHAVFRKSSEAWRNRTGSRPRFLGKSSRYMFLQKVLDYRYLYAGKAEASPTAWNPRPRAEYWDSKHVGDFVRV